MAQDDDGLISDDVRLEGLAAADAGQRAVEEAPAEAARLSLDDRNWHELVESGSRRAHALGLTEDDIPRLVSEARRDRHMR